jgi:hypothetical protein
MNFEAVDAQSVLEILSRLSVSTWSYISEGGDVRHMGPMAQDFAAAFGLGDSDTSIAMIDLHGVSLAGIQALYAQNQSLQEQVDAQQATIDAQNALLADLLQRIEALEAGNE